MFGVKKFNDYLHGREVTLITDYNPLTTILDLIKVSFSSQLLDYKDRLYSYRHFITILFLDLLVIMEMLMDYFPSLYQLQKMNQHSVKEHQLYSILLRLSRYLSHVNELQTVTCTDPIVSKVLHNTRNG